MNGYRFDRSGRPWSALAAVWLASAALAAAAPPHLVVFVTDDHGWADSTPYGARDVRTPNLQRLADAGLTFTQAFVASPACAPSRAAMLTGLMPARNGAEANHTYKRPGIPSLPEELRRLGYETAAFGKVSHNENNQRHGFEVQDKRWDAATVRGFLERRGRGRPLCLFVGTRQPHTPWLPNAGYDPAGLVLPPTFVDTPETREARSRYYTDVSDADRELGEIHDLIQAQLDGPVVFVYTSDNGAQWPFGKWTLYDAGIRVPLIVKWPGVVAPGRRTDAMVSWLDLLPTLIELAGGKAPPTIDGRSFAAVLRGESSRHRESIVATHSGDGRMNVYPMRALRTTRWKYIWNVHPEFAYTTHIDQAEGQGNEYFDSWRASAGADGRARAVIRRYHERPAEELFDLEADPSEQRNLATDPVHAARARAMRTELATALQAQGDEFRVFQEPRLLAQPASYAPGAGAREAKEAAKSKSRAAGPGSDVAAQPAMRWADESRGRPFAKDPSVAYFKNRYLMYYSIPPLGDKRPNDGWAIGIATSADLTAWSRIGELLPAQECDRKGLCAPGAWVHDGRLHLFYQTYGNGPKDAICHAWSEDGVTFVREPTNPIFAPRGDWTAGRAIDAEVFPIGDRLLLYFATRDPGMKSQMVGVAAAPLTSDFSRPHWRQLVDGPILKPELPWERRCIEAPTVLRRGDTLWMFYAGGYNNEPQQIGVATSRDGVTWTRFSDQPLLPNGAPDAWNASESGHPGVFVDHDGRTHLFFQGNRDKGRTWYLSRVEIDWRDERPVVRR